MVTDAGPHEVAPMVGWGLPDGASDFPCPVRRGAVAHSAEGWVSHHSLYGTLGQQQNQGSANLEANVTHSRRGLSLGYKG